MLASYRVHEMRVSRKLTPGLSVWRTKVFRSLIACKTFYRQTCAKTSPILLFWPCSITAAHSKTRSKTPVYMPSSQHNYLIVATQSQGVGDLPPLLCRE